MGAKRLKAVAVARGKRRIPVQDAQVLSAIAGEFLEKGKETPKYKWGTLTGFRSLHVAGGLPIKNYTATTWEVGTEEVSKFGEEYIRNNFPGKLKPCWACQFHHCRILRIAEGPCEGMTIEEPEYEQFAGMGPVIGVTDLSTVMRLSHEVDRLGMDVNEAGWTLAFAMECYQNGLLTSEDTNGLELNWGNGAAALELLNRIANRRGVGTLLAEGVMRASRQMGGMAPGLAIHTMKGNTPRTHDHRFMWPELFDTSVSNLGTLEHNPMMSLGQLGLAPGDLFSPDYISTIEAKTKGAMVFEDSLGVCRFNTLTELNLLCRALNAITGWDFDIPEAMRAGRRAVNLARLFNMRHGISPKLDAPSSRYGSTPTEGRAKGQSSSAVWQHMLSNYYALMGWDESGMPLPETLNDLGLGHLVNDLEHCKSEERRAP